MINVWQIFSRFYSSSLNVFWMKFFVYECKIFHFTCRYHILRVICSCSAHTHSREHMSCKSLWLCACVPQNRVEKSKEKKKKKTISKISSDYTQLLQLMLVLSTYHTVRVFSFRSLTWFVIKWKCSCLKADGLYSNCHLILCHTAPNDEKKTEVYYAFKRYNVNQNDSSGFFFLHLNKLITSARVLLFSFIIVFF